MEARFEEISRDVRPCRAVGEHTSDRDHTSGRLEHSYELLTRLRQLGIRAHACIRKK